MTEQQQDAPSRADQWKKIALRLFFLGVAVVILYFFLPTVVDFLSKTPQLASVQWWWYVIMGALMTGAFMAAWELTHIAVPGISRFVAACSQLVSNAMAKVIPGGAVAAGATYFQMLSVSGVPTAKAAAALAAVSFISNLVLFSLPGVAVVIAAVSAPIPDGLLPVAVAGTVLFILLFTAVVIVVKFDKPLLWIGRIVENVVGWFAERLHRDWSPTAQGFLDQRNEVVAALGKRWWRALIAAVLNWTLDYLVLVTALVAVGAEPRASLVLLAFAGSAVLGMIPITPGGLGFVEVGLVAMLTLAGIPGPDATLATLAYRLFQFWLPIPAGAVAYVVFKRRYGRPGELQEAAA
ncbi:MAG: lysylphosphatidylglycerol synthase transmembrane domain-containing protein [Acidimicrobiia bacterium]|nr:lysylphosphatidylglycerol synthase transmembrane domain-containing protein [Acidimicrobiia bacterium]